MTYKGGSSNFPRSFKKKMLDKLFTVCYYIRTQSRKRENMFSSPRCLFIFVAMLLVGCEVVITPADAYDPEYYTVEETEVIPAVQPSIEVTTEYVYCDDYSAESPYYSQPFECTDFYDYYSGDYEGTCCKWDTYDDTWLFEEEWCNWEDECVGWRYIGSEVY